MKKRLFFFFSVLLILSCNDTKNSNWNTENQTDGGFAVAAEEGDPVSFKNVANSYRGKVERKLIKKGDISFETDDPGKTYNLLAKLIKTHQAYIAQDIENKNEYRYNRDITIRLPKQNFDAFIHDLSSSVGELDSKNIDVNDVTEEYIDLESRLKAKRELETRYLELIKKAKNVEEVLNVEKELGKLQSDIESMLGRMNYINNKVSMSTLSINYYQKFERKVTSNKENKILRSLKNGWKILEGFTLGLLSLWPVFIFGALLVFILRRFKNRRRK